MAKSKFIIFIFLICFFAVPSSSLETTSKTLTIKPGKTLAIWIESSEPLKKLEGDIRGKKYPFYKVGDKYRGILGLDPLTTPGGYTLTLQATDLEERQTEKTQKIEVLGRKVILEKVVLPQDKKNLLVQENLEYDQKKFKSVLTREVESQYWTNKFLIPVIGRITSSFGVFRGNLGFHRGIDLSGPAGKLIKAANAGKVVLAERLKVHGNTIVINHGQGVFTLYCHMLQFKVEVGDILKKGHFLGTVGNTGVSTAAHLHWGLSVHDVRVDPTEWTKKEF